MYMCICWFPFAGGWTGGSVGTLVGGSELSEKQELTVLNARLMQYIRHMRESKSFSKVGKTIEIELR